MIQLDQDNTGASVSARARAVMYFVVFLKPLLFKSQTRN